MSNRIAHSEVEHNKALVADYYARVWNAKALDALKDYVADDYIQHNPHLANGRAALEGFLEGLFGQVPAGRFTVARLVAEGDLVVAHTLFQAHAEDRGTAVVDLYRIRNGKLVEHWDVKEAIPEATANGNSVV
ncbi:ester cyclase [Methylocapsa sp. S129]|uniref:nuclear transport factor 2 family protein n=1 Tax=Methylocapsa sp. S129 TaxID=1641869 RepID=UPI00131B94D4|nr:nuclear transport factor 2 family protein [Methylocapsa sp. S129]